MPSEENDNDEGDEGDVDGELEDRWRDDMRDMYNMLVSTLPEGHSHESIDAMHRAHNDADVRSHRDDELSESDVPDLVSSSDSDDRPFG